MIANTYVVKPFGISEVKVIALKGEPGGPTQEQVNAAVEEYMDDHPEAQIPDGAVTTEKLASNAVAPYADNLVSSSYVSDSEPYLFRKTFAGVREDTEIVGGSVVWNQLIDVISKATVTGQGITYTNNGDGSFTLTGTPTTNNAFANINYVAGVNPYILDHVYLMDSGYTGDKKIGVFVYGITSSHIVVYSTPIIQKADQIGANGYVRFQVTDLQGTDIGTVKLTPQLFDLTLLFGSEIADYIYAQEQATAGAGVALAKAWAGITAAYYPYDAGSIKSVTGLTAHRMTGFNQWDEEWEVGMFNNSTGEKMTATVRMRNKNPIRISPQMGYYLNFADYRIGSLGLDLYFYDSSGSFLSYFRKWSSNLSANQIPSGASYMNFCTQPEYGTTYKHDICINFSDPSKNGTYEPYTAHTYPLDSSLTLRGLLKLDGDSIYYDGDVYKADGTVERRYGYRAYQSGDEYLANAITDGTHTVYKLTTATTETADPFTNPQVCYPNGTEEYIDTREVPIPVGHNTKYMRDLKKLLEGIPDAPSADGTYVLKATVSSSGVTYSWVAG